MIYICQHVMTSEEFCAISFDDLQNFDIGTLIFVYDQRVCFTDGYVVLKDNITGQNYIDMLNLKTYDTMMSEQEYEEYLKEEGAIL